ncbi:MAG: cyclase family protein, partial [Pikeienuella sp.]
MCDICVMNAVKERMLSLRDLFRGGAAAAAATGAGVAIGSAIAPPALAAGVGRVEDMTHELSEDFPTWPGTQG